MLNFNIKNKYQISELYKKICLYNFYKKIIIKKQQCKQNFVEHKKY